MYTRRGHGRDEQKPKQQQRTAYTSMVQDDVKGVMLTAALNQGGAMSGVTIMMVDDETEILKLMEIYVKNEGYTLLTASHGLLEILEPIKWI